MPIDLAAAVRRFARGEIAWLDSESWIRHVRFQAAPGTLPAARYSLVATDPVAVVLQRFGRAAEFCVADRVLDSDESGWALWLRVARHLGRRGGRHRVGEHRSIGPGWVGFAGFESAAQLDRFPHAREDSLGLPLLRFALFDRAIVIDHAMDRAFLVVADGLRERLNLPELHARATIEEWQSACDCRSAIEAPAKALGELQYHALAIEHERVAPTDFSRERYERAVRRALEYIAAGDMYQVNLARRILLQGALDPWLMYSRVRTVNPSPYAAMLCWPEDDGTQAGVLSCSPELMLAVDGRDCRTHPIKGTRRRTPDARTDAAAAGELLRSPKDAAELAMIIDLHRNDLGRVCEHGSIAVEDPRRLESHPGVHHTVGLIAGRLRAGLDAGDALAACFPAGSISGVPKIRAMQIIHELEPSPRGVYTGAIGVWGLDGRMTMSVAIRIVQFRGGRAALHVGGGIVAESTPSAEFEETEAKAAGLLRGLGVAIDHCETAQLIGPR